MKYVDEDETHLSIFGLSDVEFNEAGDTPVLETVVNLLQRVKLNISDSDLLNLCDKYVLSDGMKPEQVASKLYNDPYLHWTILYVNDVLNLSSNWPLSDVSLSAFVTKKYGAGKEYNIHHYELANTGIWVDPPIYDSHGVLIANFAMTAYGINPTPYTNYDYESNLNALKRNIIVIKPQYISTFVDMYKKSLMTVSPLGQ